MKTFGTIVVAAQTANVQTQKRLLTLVEWCDTAL